MPFVKNLSEERILPMWLHLFAEWLSQDAVSLSKE